MRWFRRASAREEKEQKKRRKSWYSDRYQSAVVQRNIMLLLTIWAMAITLVSVLYMAQMANSKTFEPYVIVVDKKSGITTRVDQKTVEVYTSLDAVKRYFVHKYLAARESYNVNEYLYNYGTLVRLFSTSDVYNGFMSELIADIPTSPLKLGRDGTREVRVKSIAFPAKDRAQIRVQINESRPGVATREDHKIINMSFDFFNIALTAEERYISPLGFQVTAYRIDEESQQ